MRGRGEADGLWWLNGLGLTPLRVQVLNGQTWRKSHLMPVARVPRARLVRFVRRVVVPEADGRTGDDGRVAFIAESWHDTSATKREAARCHLDW